MVNVHIRDVPDSSMERIREHAELAGMSVQKYLRRLINRDAEMLSVEEAVALARSNAAGSGVTTDDILAAIAEERAERE